MTSFPLEKILEVDNETYFRTQSSTIGLYDLVGVRFEGGSPQNITRAFAYQVPENAEVVINYRVVFWDDHNSEGQKIVRANAYGTALVPKK